MSSPATATRRSNPSATLGLKMMEVMIASPFVIANRMSRMAVAGVTPTAKDKAEFALMNDEKSEAFVESWRAMAATALGIQQRFARNAMMAAWNPTTYLDLAAGRMPRSMRASLSTAGTDAIAISLAGLQPVHKRATGNAKRLTRGG